MEKSVRKITGRDRYSPLSIGLAKLLDQPRPSCPRTPGQNRYLVYNLIRWNPED